MSEHKPLTDEELTEMQTRCDAATPRPWKRQKPLALVVVADYCECFAVASTHGFKGNTGPDEIANADLIAAARTDLPRVLEDNKRLRTDNKNLRENLLGVLVRNHYAEMERKEELRAPIRETPALENTVSIPNSKEFFLINGDQPERQEATARARWKAARKDWGGLVGEDDIGEPEQDALDYVAQHVGFGDPIVYLNVRAAPMHGTVWVAYPNAGKAIRAPLSFLMDPALDDNTIARMQIKAVRGGHAFKVYNTLVNLEFRNMAGED